MSLLRQVRRNTPSTVSLTLGLSDLCTATECFFNMHWNRQVIGHDPPEWLHWPEFRGSVPNYQLGGCYALFEGSKLCYIGVGASRGGGLYPQHGISRRLMSHVLRSDRAKGPEWSKPRVGWEGIDSIYTIGFTSNVAHLSSSLESFLIRKFSGQLKNVRV
jgi:hypothetical protein